ncbi:hypothetical protein PR202_gb17665 [Eleusine coracana subsp. coracana]|uniref:Trimethylguanosine synthase n=1 Tax=Eleusine coracana subsp. coracana TaxID=191504 RepID=A0AAV5F1A7_ELECO|nr:hypothetical protein PR202_gb17665 [Eleusine coracana subsp. coracana]
MAKRSAAPAASRRRRRLVCVIPFLNRCPLRLLAASARNPARRITAGSTHEIARPKEEEEPKHTEAAEESHKAVEAQALDAPANDASAVAGKYWAHRHNLFSLYDHGVRMDAEGWYSATPESVAASQAARAAPRDLVVDAFAGCGGNSIQFAVRHADTFAVLYCTVVSVVQLLLITAVPQADVVFLSPPWGGPAYIQAPVYSLDMLKPKDGYAVSAAIYNLRLIFRYTTFQAAQRISPNIIMFLPRTVDIDQVEELSWLSSPPLYFESEENFVNHRCKGVTAYFGKTARLPGT